MTMKTLDAFLSHLITDRISLFLLKLTNISWYDNYTWVDCARNSGEFLCTNRTTQNII